MSLSPEVFVAGVGLLVGLDILCITLTYQAKNDEKARETAKAARLQAAYQGRRLSQHLREEHDQDIEVASPDGGELSLDFDFDPEMDADTDPSDVAGD